MIHSNANLGVHGQGLLNLSGSGDTIEAQRLILSLFYSIQVRKIMLTIYSIHLVLLQVMYILTTIALHVVLYRITMVFIFLWA